LVDTDPAYFTPHPIVGIKAGSYAIRAVVTDNDGATATSTATIIAGSGTPTPTPPPSTSGITFTLVSASSNSSLGALSNGVSLSSSKTQNVNIRANAPSGAKSVVMTLSGATSTLRVEDVAPFALFGDSNGNYFSGSLKSGSYSLKASAYSGNGGSGSVIASTTINFSVTGSVAKASIAYTNPIKSDGRVAIKLPEGVSGDIKYSVTNSLGVEIEQGQFNAEQPAVDLELSNIGRQVQGIYYLTIISADSKQTLPLIKE
jgi:hypothetical protein